MGNIILKNASFGYETTTQKYVLENINLNIHTSWKLGILGKNGSGKTTLLHMIQHKKADVGQVLSNEDCIYFPLKESNNFQGTVREFYDLVIPDVEDWEIFIEFEQIGLDEIVLEKEYQILSEGEKCKVQLVTLFCHQHKFPLIDEPTNNLDWIGRRIVANYLKSKKGFVIISHDEQFLNDLITHVAYIENGNVELIRGNVSTYKLEKEKQLKQLESTQNKLKKEIKRLDEVSKTIKNWGDKREKETKDSASRRMAAKQMKRAKAVEKRVESKIEQKESLIQHIQNERTLKINTIKDGYKTTYLQLENYAICLNNHDKYLFSPIDITLSTGDIIWIRGENGIGKTVFLKNILNLQRDKHSGTIKSKMDNVSYVSQKNLSIEEIKDKFNQLDRNSKEMFYFNLNLIGFRSNKISEILMNRNWSMGELKKMAVALSLVTPTKIVIWDELSNFLDMETINKLIEAVQIYKPTLMFVEHNEYFGNAIANKTLELK